MALLLVVDDERSLREMTVFALTSVGHDVVEADNGDVALQLLQTGTLPDLILLDLSMPVCSGYDVLAKLRTDPLLSAIPVVVFTSEEVPEGEVEGKAVLHKPIGERELLDLVDTICSRDVALHQAMKGAPTSFLSAPSLTSAQRRPH